MKKLASLVSLLVFAGTAGVAEDNGISRVIAAQLSALSDRDFQSAYAFASPAIQAQIPTTKGFGRMVQDHFPMMMEVGEVAFIDQVEMGSLVLQRVRITDTRGHRYWFAYEMVSVEGRWRVNGVVRIGPPGSMT